MKLRSVLWILVACTAMAHDMEVTVQQSFPAVVVHAAYYGHDPAAFVQATVYSPGQKQSAYQTGQTDVNGCFSFVPRVPGNWTVIIDDGEGHREEISVVVNSESAAEPTRTPAVSPPLWQKLVTGLSLILGLAGLLYGVLNRRPAAG